MKGGHAPCRVHKKYPQDHLPVRSPALSAPACSSASRQSLSPFLAAKISAVSPQTAALSACPQHASLGLTAPRGLEISFTQAQAIKSQRVPSTGSTGEDLLLTPTCFKLPAMNVRPSPELFFTSWRRFSTWQHEPCASMKQFKS